MLNTNRSNLEVLTANNFPRPFTTDDLDEMEDIDESIGPLVQESGYITVMSMPQEGGILVQGLPRVRSWTAFSRTCREGRLSSMPPRSSQRKHELRLHLPNQGKCLLLPPSNVSILLDNSIPVGVSQILLK